MYSAGLAGSDNIITKVNDLLITKPTGTQTLMLYKIIISNAYEVYNTFYYYF